MIQLVLHNEFIQQISFRLIVQHVRRPQLATDIHCHRIQDQLPNLTIIHFPLSMNSFVFFYHFFLKIELRYLKEPKLRTQSATFGDGITLGDLEGGQLEMLVKSRRLNVT